MTYRPESEVPRHYKKRGKRKKPYKIECRYIGTRLIAKTFPRMFSREWRVCGEYETERQRRDALRGYENKGDVFYGEFEYRLAVESEAPDA